MCAENFFTGVEMDYQNEWTAALSPHRLGQNENCGMDPTRSPFQRDFDRLVFSGALRRMQDKTQVFPLEKREQVHTRLTHCLETSSVGRSLGCAVGAVICRRYGLPDITPSDFGALTGAAALAHDIGNPPLGHAGEDAIRYWFRESGVGREMADRMTAAERADFEYYEGNAQGFRVLTRLEMPERRGGMQLTCGTLAAFAKYPCGALERSPGIAGNKYNFFCSEFELFREVAGRTGMVPAGERCWKRHPLAFLVEAADDISYTIVDFEDGLRLGVVSGEELEDCFCSVIGGCPGYDGYRVQLNQLAHPLLRAEYLRALAIGALVKLCVREFLDNEDKILTGDYDRHLVNAAAPEEPMRKIREISRRRLYNNRGVIEVIGAGFEMVSGMLDIFVPCVNDLAEHGENGASLRSVRMAALLPDLEEHLADAEWRGSAYLRLQSVLDCISAMTDSYAVGLYQKLKGISL